ncbi:MAG: uroporphyrinogen decarboxylase family protein [Armatimonadota bacterium]
MTGRERLLNILDRKPVDKLAWTTLIDGPSRASMSEEVQAMSHVDFYRYVGCDILTLGAYGLQENEQPVPPYQIIYPNTQTEWDFQPDGTARQKRKTPWGVLTAEFRNGHPTKYPVESLDDLRILEQIYLDLQYIGQKADYSPALNAIGDSGIFADAIAPSPVQQLIEMEMGLEGFYYMLDDHRQDVERLLDTMHTRRLQEYELLARGTDADVIIPMENTSTMLTSFDIYKRYSLPQVRDYVDTIHKYDKKAVVHMCGHLKALLPLIRDTGMDGANAVTPPPVGNTMYEDVLDVCGEDFIILGGIIPPNVIHKTTLSYAELSSTLHALYTPRVRKAHMLMWMGVDGLPTDLERFRMMRRWFDENGTL